MCWRRRWLTKVYFHSLKPRQLWRSQIKALGGDELIKYGEDLTRFAADPVGLIRYVEPDRVLTPEQVQILESVRDRKTTNVQAAHGVGKTWIAGWIVMWYVF